MLTEWREAGKTDGLSFLEEASDHLVEPCCRCLAADHCGYLGSERRALKEPTNNRVASAAEYVREPQVDGVKGVAL